MEVAASQPAPLQPDFVEWWFAPWNYACHWSSDMDLPAGQVGRRDGYALWCHKAGVQAQFPALLDGGWQIAALSSRTRLEKIATLFAGLLAAREKNLKGMNGLNVEDRRWCISIAGLQPLLGLAANTRIRGAAPGTVERGLLELRGWLEFGFPGMWSRLRHLLHEDLARSIDDSAGAFQPGHDMESVSAAAIRRAQRCWQLCADRALASADEDEDEPAAAPAPLTTRKRA